MDGKHKIVLLTRVEGVNTIYIITIQHKAQSYKARVFKQRKLMQVSYPHVLGPPSLSPDGKYVAFIHRYADKNHVKVYKSTDGSSVASTIGGGDTLRCPAWSQDSRHLFFLSDDQKGIVVWKSLQELQTKTLSHPVFGRYMSCSNDGRYLTFFQNSAEGKGKVNLCFWEWDKITASVQVREDAFMTAETCRPQWSPDGRFLALIEKGSRDRVLIQDNATREIYPIFSQQGRVAWINWNSKGILMFSYREGLFTRPYRVEFD